MFVSQIVSLIVDTVSFSVLEHETFLDIKLSKFHSHFLALYSKMATSTRKGRLKEPY